MGTTNQLSFLPDDYLERKGQRRANAICAVLFVLVMAGVGAGFTLTERATKRIDDEYARVEEQYLSEAKRLEQVREMQEKQRRMARQAELSASLLERVPRSYLLADITNAMPAGASLLDFTLDSKIRARPATDAPKTAYEQKKAAKQGAAGAAAAPAEPKLYDVALKLTGVARSDVQVAQFLRNLSRSKLLRDVNLVISEEHAQSEEKLRKFQIEMMINPDAEVQVAEPKLRQAAAIELKE
jgi:Tfp pilus assembly protein PilN